MIRWPVHLFLLLAFCILLISCEKNRFSDPEIIHIAVLPDQSKQRLKERFGDLVNYLNRETGIRFEWVFTKDYQDLLDRFDHKEIQLARFGGLTFIQSRTKSGAEPLVMRDVDANFTSSFIVRASDPATSLTEFKGRTFSFGSRLSTSGHLMPRYFLQENGIVPEQTFAEVRYSGAHDRTVYQVRDGDIDLGVANEIVVNQMFENGQVSNKEVRILWNTPPYPDYVWAVQPGLSNKLKIRIIDAFLRLSRDNEQHVDILNHVAASFYLPAKLEDFEALQVISQKLGLLEIK